MRDLSLKASFPTLTLLASITIVAACGDKSAATEASAAASGTAGASQPALTVPATTEWRRELFAPMRIAFKAPPSLKTDEPEMTQEAAARWGPEIWSMSTETQTGVGVHVSELRQKAKQDRETWLKEMQEGAIPGEVVFAADDAVVRKTRVLGKKTDDGGPVLSKTHLDVGACKKLEEIDYCLHISGTADMALDRPGLTPAEALELVAMVRSLERDNTVVEAPVASASASASASAAGVQSGTLPAR